ncbi:hypothetical protein T484DRAFT_1817279, partial [Baffinella frigidus]
AEKDEESLGAFVTLGGKDDGDGQILAEELRAFVTRMEMARSSLKNSARS